METKISKKEYLEKWLDYTDYLKWLCWTPNDKTSEEVKITVEKLQALIKKVACEKYSKGDKLKD